MTPSRYYVARFAQAFGYFRRNIRMADAASEMHLLREAEAQLGASIWEKVGNVEELSVEYWNLRKCIKEREMVRAKLAECQDRLDQAHTNRVEILSNSTDIDPELLEKRIALLTSLEAMSIQRDEIIAEAREVRRSYEGLKMKLEVLTSESSANEEHLKEILRVKSRLAEFKIRFAELKERRAQIAEKISAGDADVDVLDGQLNEMRMNRRSHASEAFQLIGDSNKDMAILRAESGVLDIQMRQLYAEIGRFVSRRSEQHQGCADAAVDHRNLIEVMRALRRSIALNHRLAGTA